MTSLGVEEFAERFRVGITGKKVGVFSHPRVDPDGYAAALAISELVIRLGATSSYAYLDDMNSLAKRMSRHFPAPLPPEGYSPDVAVVVDACGLKYAHRGKGFLGSTVYVIDHHQCGSVEPAHRYVDLASTSSCELVVKLMEALGVRPHPFLATALLGGLLFDTAIFKYGNSESVKAAADLIHQGADYALAVSFATREQSRSLRMAKLRAAQRVKLSEAGDLVVALSTADVFEGEVAESLLNLGANVALVASPRGSGVRISGRADAEAISSGVNLAELFGENGGGHEGAAGALVQGDPETVLQYFLDKLVERLSKPGFALRRRT